MSENWNIQISPKLPDGTLVNIRAESYEQLQSLLAAVRESAQDITTTVAVLFAGGNAANAGLTSAPQQQLPPNQQPPFSAQGGGQIAPAQQWGQPAPQQQSGPAPTCRHGEMKYRPAGTSKNTGKPYKAFWSCTGPRNEQCDTQNAA